MTTDVSNVWNIHGINLEQVDDSSQSYYCSGDYKLAMQDNEAQAQVEQTTSDFDSLSSLKVMIIDDSRTIRKSAESLLSKEGCEVLTAEDGFDALAKIAEHKPDLIFVDIMMPKLDGYQTCTLIKNNRQFRDTPVIMLTSKDSIFDKARGRIVGSEEYLTKPFTRDDLIQAVTRHVTH